MVNTGCTRGFRGYEQVHYVQDCGGWPASLCKLCRPTDVCYQMADSTANFDTILTDLLVGIIYSVSITIRQCESTSISRAVDELTASAHTKCQHDMNAYRLHKPTHPFEMLQFKGRMLGLESSPSGDHSLKSLLHTVSASESEGSDAEEERTRAHSITCKDTQVSSLLRSLGFMFSE